jgi:hypothetical protein
MPDTEAEKQTGINDCNKCKYKDTCGLFVEWTRLSKISCTMGVK